nr:hypothetical protein CFP56_69465 [Quercus suber]
MRTSPIVHPFSNSPPSYLLNFAGQTLLFRSFTFTFSLTKPTTIPASARVRESEEDLFDSHQRALHQHFLLSTIVSSPIDDAPLPQWPSLVR